MVLDAFDEEPCTQNKIKATINNKAKYRENIRKKRRRTMAYGYQTILIWV